MALVVKNLPASAGDTDTGSIHGREDSPGGRHGNPLLYSCLENPMDRGVGQATIHRAAKSRTRLKQFSMHKNYKNLGLSPGLKTSPGGGHGNPPQYSCLENPRDRGALRAIGHRVAQSQTRLKRGSTRSCKS